MAGTRQTVDPVTTPDPNVDPNQPTEQPIEPIEQPQDMRLKVVACEAFLRTQAKGGGVRYRSILSGSDAALSRFKATQGQYYIENEAGQALYTSDDSLEVGSYLVERNGRYNPEELVSQALQTLHTAQGLASRIKMSQEAQGALYAQLIMKLVTQ